MKITRGTRPKKPGVSVFLLTVFKTNPLIYFLTKFCEFLLRGIKLWRFLKSIKANPPSIISYHQGIGNNPMEPGFIFAIRKLIICIKSSIFGDVRSSTILLDTHNVLSLDSSILLRTCIGRYLSAWEFRIWHKNKLFWNF